MPDTLEVVSNEREQVDGVCERSSISHISQVRLTHTIARLPQVYGLEAVIEKREDMTPGAVVCYTLSKCE